MVIILPWEQTRANQCPWEWRSWIQNPFSPPTHQMPLRTSTHRGTSYPQRYQGADTWCRQRLPPPSCVWWVQGMEVHCMPACVSA